MKFKIIPFLLALTLLSCNKDDGPNDNNPFLITPIVNVSLNLNLPQFNALLFPGSSVELTQQGVRGIIVYNVNNSLYTAFDLSDPNHIPNECSRMEVEGILASCPCESDNNVYDIVTGQHNSDPTLFPLQQYRAERIGDNIVISN